MLLARLARLGVLTPAVLLSCLLVTGCNNKKGDSRAASTSSGASAPGASTPTLVVVKGAAQVAQVGSQAAAIEVMALDGQSNPVEGVVVGFGLPYDPALHGDGRLSDASVTTGKDGVARSVLTLDTAAGVNQVRVYADGYDPITVRATGTPGPVETLTMMSGDGQRGPAGMPLPQPLMVEAKDRFQNPVPDVQIDFTSAGGTTVDKPSVLTDKAGMATVLVTLGTSAGMDSISAGTPALFARVVFNLMVEAGPAAQMALATGDAQSGVVASELPAPLQVKVADRYGNPVAGVAVSFAVAAGGGTLSAAQAATDAQGLAGVKLTLGQLAGVNSVTASVAGLTGSPVSFTAMGTAGAAAKVELDAGDAQAGVVNQPLQNPLSVKVSDRFGNPVQGFMVQFSVVAGGGKLAAANVPTDAAGKAATALTLGTLAGPNQVRATGTGIQTPALFNALANPGPAASLAIAAGQNQTGQVAKELAQPLVVQVVDGFGNPVANVAVAFEVQSGGGALSASTVPTDAKGQALSKWTLGAAVGANQVRVSSGNLAGSPALFSASGVAGPASQLSLASGNQQSGVAGSALAQPFVVLVRDAGGNPVQGFMVAFAVASGGGSLSATTVATDATGRASSRLTLGKAVGPNSVTATAAGLTGSPLTFTASGTAGPATQMARVSGDAQTGQVGSLLAQALIVEVKDANGNAVAGHPVSFTAELGTVSPQQATTDAQGRASTRWTLGATAGMQRAVATSNGLAGSPIVFTASATAMPASSIALASGNGQTGVAGQALALPFVVTVKDASGNPVEGFMVGFAVSSGGGVLSATSVLTGAQGSAAATLTLGPQAGTNTVVVTAAGLSGSPLTFTATGQPGKAAKLVVVSGDKQSGQAGSALPNPLVVRVTDANDNPVQGTPVAFAVTAGGGSLSAASATSDAQGLASTRLTLGPAAGANSVTASSAGLTGSPVTFTASGMAAAASQLSLASGNGQTGVAGGALAQPFVVLVRDAQNQPVQGFMVAFAVASGGGTLSQGTVASDAQGRAATTLTLGRAAGQNSVTATAAGLAGSPITFTATGNAGPAAKLTKLSGDAQSGGVGSALANPLVVLVADQNDNPVGGVALTFTVASGGGTVSPATASTDTAGRAQTRLTLGPAPGANSVRVSGTGLTAVTFTATGNALPPSTLAKNAGDAQSARIGMALANPLVVKVTDAQGQPVPGIAVAFAVTAGGGTLSAASASTDAQGLASTRLSVGPNLGANTVSATVSGLTAVSFSASGTPLTYVDDVKSIMTAKCVVCHGPGGVFAVKPLTTYDQIRNGMSLGGQPFVVPNNAATSVMVQKTQAGGSMADKLTAAEAKVLLDWVRTGAVDGGAAQVPTSVSVVSGNAQQGQPGQRLANPLVVIVRDAMNQPVANVAVAWSITSGGGTLSAASTTTDLLGQAMVTWTLGPAAGANGARAVVGALSPAAFTANAVSSYSGAPLTGSTHPLDVAALSVLRTQNIEPAALCSDGEFIRRTTANLLGRMPREAELSAFLADGAADKRARLVDQLLASDEFANFWAKQVIGVWAEVPSTVTEDVNGTQTTYTFDAALIDDLKTDVSLNTIVTRFATSQGMEGQAFRVRHDYNGGNGMSDQLMWAFAGMTSKCARCHDHPLTGATDDPRWIQDDNYGLYAFFATSNGAATKLNKSGSRFGSAVQPRFVADGYANVPPANVTLADPVATRRARFAQLFTASNAYARGTAHRIWSEIAAPLLDPNQFLKVNLDGVAVPALLDALTQLFKQQNGSLKGFLRTAMASRLYQLSSAGANTAADRYQGRYVLRRHTGEALEQGVHSLAGLTYSANQIFAFNFGFPTRDSLESRGLDVSMEQALLQLNSPISTPGKVVSNSSQIANLAAAVDGGAIKQIIPSTSLVSAGGQAGLDAAIYDTIDFTGPALNRVDREVGFDFGSGSPASSIGADTFSVRWTGSVRIPATGSYTFFTRTDDGVRLWIDGNLVIDRFVDQGPTEYSATLNLTAGNHTIRMDYYENGGGAVAELRWSSPLLGGSVTFDDAVTAIVRSALSRDPTPAELTAARTARTGAANTRQALEDVAVAVGASAEFMFR